MDQCQAQAVVTSRNPTQELQILQVLGTAGRFLVTNKGGEPKVEDGLLPGPRAQSHRDPGGPSLLKRDPVDLVERVDAVGRTTKLNYRAPILEFRDAINSRDVAFPKGHEHPKQGRGVLVPGVIKKIDIPGQSCVPLVNDRFPTDHDITHLVCVEEFNELEDVR